MRLRPIFRSSRRPPDETPLPTTGPPGLRIAELLPLLLPLRPRNRTPASPPSVGRAAAAGMPHAREGRFLVRDRELRTVPNSEDARRFALLRAVVRQALPWPMRRLLPRSRRRPLLPMVRPKATVVNDFRQGPIGRLSGRTADGPLPRPRAAQTHLSGRGALR